MADRTRAVNLRREPYDVYIGRAGKGHDGYFGNPFTVARHGQAAYDMFRDYFHGRLGMDPEFRRRVLELRGKRLGCFCAPRACHGDIIAAWVDAQPVEEAAVANRMTVAQRRLLRAALDMEQDDPEFLWAARGAQKWTITALVERGFMAFVDECFDEHSVKTWPGYRLTDAGREEARRG